MVGHRLSQCVFGLAALVAVAQSGVGAEAPKPVYRLERSVSVDLGRLLGVALGPKGQRLYAVGRGGVRVLGADGKELARWSTSGPATCVAVA